MTEQEVVMAVNDDKTFSDDDNGTTYTYREIRDRAPDLFHMDLPPGDARIVTRIVNQSIDAHLEACYVPDRGDAYKVVRMMFSDENDYSRLKCDVSKESLPVLLRRLFESDIARAHRLGRIIVETLHARSRRQD